MPKKQSGTGLKKESAAALSYVLGPVTGIIFLVLEQDPFVRFHAMQSIVVFGVLIVLQALLGLTVIFSVFVPLLSLVAFALWLILIYKAFNGEKWEVPFVSQIVKQLLNEVPKSGK